MALELAVFLETEANCGAKPLGHQLLLGQLLPRKHRTTHEP